MRSAVFIDSGANAMNPLAEASSGAEAFAIGAQKVRVYIAIMSKVALRIKRFSFGLGIGLGSLLCPSMSSNLVSLV